MADSKFLEVKKVLHEKAPNIAKKIPGFVINYLSGIIHEDELNDIVQRNKHLNGVEFMQAMVKEFDLTLDIINEENLPADGGRYIFASNHPLGGLDGISLAAFLGGKYNGNIRYLVNDVLLYIPNLRSIFVPINKYGSQSRTSTVKIDEAFASDYQILSFPSGYCSRRKKGIIKDLKWKKSFIQKAVAYRRDIVPILFEGKNSNFFYRLANIRTRLGFKMNYEMLYLPDEMFKNRHQTFRIYIGEPVSWRTFNKTKTAIEWAKWVEDKVYNLNKN
ncbi:MAG: 1-acyl-sn-glycerol-3-phosphate acyltransferase [Tannerella sp.]|jgi:putative hemolysin|nr:1-acyl-sn-glycerol-3-phosphate acyltransferase [Tannerella sp.]